MAMRIDTPMATFKTQDSVMDKMKEFKNQSLNPQALEQEEKKTRDEELKKTQALDEAEFTAIDNNKRERDRQDGGNEQEDEEAATLELSEEARRLDEARRLAELAAGRFLELPVDKGKFIVPEEHKFDLRL